ncbi:MAG: hemin receptor [Oxalobacteraceae bacterium]|nr:MAG: hemin receptor [Oxalobacteraceae bacterium]
MTARHIDLVQDSFAQILPIAEQAASVFYERLFEMAPDTRALFREDMREQGRKLFQTLALVVDALHRIDDVLPVAGSLAVRHVGYGVDECHYEAVGKALIETLRHELGEGFNEDVEGAWALAYELLSQHMIDAARGGVQSKVAA